MWVAGLGELSRKVWNFWTSSPLPPSLSDVNHFGRIKQQVCWTRSLDLADEQIAGDSATISLTVSKAEGKFKPPAQNIPTVSSK